MYVMYIRFLIKNNIVMFTYDIITDVNNNRYTLIRFANTDSDSEIDCFSTTEETEKYLIELTKNVPDNIEIYYHSDVLNYLFS